MSSFTPLTSGVPGELCPSVTGMIHTEWANVNIRFKTAWKWPSNSTSTFITNRSENMTCTQSAYDSILHDSQKSEATQTSVSWRMDTQMWCIRMMEYYAALKRNEVLMHATLWMNLENIMPSERKQSPHITSINFNEISRGRGEGSDGEWLLLGGGFLSEMMKIFWN